MKMGQVDPEILLLPPEYDAALMGYLDRACQNPVAVYHQDKIIEILMASGASYESALDHLEFNIKGGWQGPYTPGFLIMFEDKEEVRV